MKKILVAILNKLLVKISGLEEYNQQLIKIEKSITELRDLLASEKGKDAKTIFDLLSKSSKEDLDKIVIIIETTRSIRDKDVNTIFDFINTYSKEDIEKITNLAETTKDFKEKDVKAMSKFINQISNEDLGEIAENIKAIQEKDARAIFEFLSKAPKKKLEKMAILAGTARLVQELDKIEIPPKSAVDFDKFRDYIEVQEVVRGLERFLKPGETISKDIPPEKIAKLRKEIERMGIFSATARVAAELEHIGPGGKTLRPGEIALQREERTLLERTPQFMESAIEPRGRVLQPGERALQREERALQPGESVLQLGERTLQPRERIRTLEGEERVIPEEVIRLYQKGIKLLSEWKNPEAYDQFDKIILDNPDLKLKGAWLNKGVAAGRLGYKQEEINCYNNALEIDKNYTAALRNLVTAGMGI